MKTSKKLMSILLAVVVMLVALPIMASAAVTTDAELNTAANWVKAADSKFASTKLAESDTTWFATSADKDPLDANVDVIKLYGNRSGAYGTVFNLEAGKNYKISFDYYSPKTTGTSGYDTALYGVAVTLGVNADTKWSDVFSNAANPTSISTWAGLSTRNEEATRVVNIVENRATYTKGTNVTNLGTTANAWHSFSAEFNSGANTTAALSLVMAGSGANNYYIKNVKLTPVVTGPELDPAATKASQDFEHEALAGDVKGGAPTLESTTGGNGAATKVARLAANSDALRFTFGNAAHWDDGSATALSASTFKISFDIKMAWNTASTAVVWFNMPTGTNSTARIRSNGAVADATDYTVTDLQGGWKHFEFIFKKAGNETAQYLQISNVSGATAISYDLDNILIEKYVVPVTTGNAAALRAASGDLKKGIRVKNNISLDSIAENDITEYGSLVTMASFANGEELKADASFTVLKGVAFDKAANKDVYFAKDTEKVTFTAVLVNIDPYSFASDILVRSYAKTSAGKYIYGDTFTLSVYDVVDAILAGDNATDKAVAQTYVDEAILADGNNPSVITYAEWKAAQ